MDGSNREWARVCAGTSGKLALDRRPARAEWGQVAEPPFSHHMACQASGLAPLAMLSQHQVPDALLSYM